MPSLSVEVANRAEIASKASTVRVAIAVTMGKRQNSHSIVTAEHDTMDNNTTRLVRAFDEVFMPIFRFLVKNESRDTVFFPGLSL